MTDLLQFPREMADLGCRPRLRRLRLLLLMAHPAIYGPLPKIGPLLVDALKKRGYDVDTAPWSRHHEDESVDEKILGRACDLWQTYRMARSRHYDCMIVTTTHDWPALMRDIPLLFLHSRICPVRVLHFHGSYCDYLVGRGRIPLKAATRFLLRQASGVFVLSTQEAREWRAFSPRTPIWRVRNPHVTARSVMEGCAAHRQEGGPFPFLYVGRLHSEKGVRELLLAFGDVSRTVDSLLHVAGIGPCRQIMEAWVSRNGLEGRVIFHGYLEGDALEFLYSTSGALVLPSYREGFPTVFFEAMEHGLPIITTALRGASDCFEAEKSALLVPARSTEQLAAAMKRIVREPELREAFRTTYPSILAEYAPERVIGDYVDAIEFMASSGRGARPSVGH